MTCISATYFVKHTDELDVVAPLELSFSGLADVASVGIPDEETRAKLEFPLNFM